MMQVLINSNVNHYFRLCCKNKQTNSNNNNNNTYTHKKQLQI